MTRLHVPVLVDEVCRLAESRRRLVDCTVGGGGHTARLAAPGRHVLAIDRDPEAIARARTHVSGGSVQWICGRYADPAVLSQVSRFEPDFVLFDLGVSSDQIDDDRRGFSFRKGLPLDMRMTPDVGRSGADLVNGLSEPELRRVFAEYADEPRAGALAAAIVRRRAQKPFDTSDDLVNAIRGVLGSRAGPPEFARLFQAVRIAVNQELSDLASALPAVLDAVVPGGVIAVISYHSGEDRIVKHRFREWARACVCPPEFPVCRCRGTPLGRMDPRRPIRPTDAEVASNPRARSAMLRVFYRADAS